MRCFRCGQNNAAYEVFLSSPQGVVRELLCEKCLSSGKFPAQTRAGARPIQTAACPYCGMTMSEYLQTGLVGCAQCYSVFAKELAPGGIRVNCILPTNIQTAQTTQEYIESQIAQYPMGFGKPVDVAHLVAFLLSSESRWITAQNYVLDCASF